MFDWFNLQNQWNYPEEKYVKKDGIRGKGYLTNLESIGM